MERFDKRVREGKRARLLFARDILQLFRPGIIKTFEGTQKLNQYDMFKNYFKVSFRNILRHKTFSFLNVAGLSVGMACCILILIYVNNELSFDSYHENSPQIYRVLQSFRDDKEVEDHATPLAEEFQVWGNAPVGPALLEDYPEVESFWRFTSPRKFLVEYEGKRFLEDNFRYADSTAFSIFSWKLISGHPQKALSGLNSLVLTETIAKKYFGDDDPMGKSVKLDGGGTAVITGVMEDVPPNSHFTFDGLLSMSTFEKMRPSIFTSWGYVDFYTYLKLKPESSIGNLASQTATFKDKHIKDYKGFDIAFEPLSEAYLYSKAARQPGPVGSLTNVYMFSYIAVFILLIACINFINLSTARSVERAKEVAIRKTIGSHQSSLVLQFLCEAILITAFGALLAVVLVSVGLPNLELLSGKVFDASWLLSPSYITIMVAGVLLLGITAGLYPALVLANYKPIEVLKGSFKTSTKGAFLRKSLVIFQFSISMVLLIGTSIVYSQLNHLRSYELGFDSDQMLVIDFGWDSKVQNRRDHIKNQFLNHKDVSAVAVSRAVPGGFFPNGGTGIIAASGDLEFHGPGMYEIDEDFIPSYEMEMVAGRNYSKNFPLDSANALIINRAASKLYGYSDPQEIIGKKFSQWGREGTVVGVVEDFNYVSLHSKIEPLALRYGTPGNTTMISMRLNSDNYSQVIPELEEIWANVAPHRPFLYHFLDNNFNAQYEEDEKFGKVFIVFASIAIFIACLGLFGLTIYSTAQRTKEIGVRKVLGASTKNIVQLLSLDFVKLFFVALIIAMPTSWYIMQMWLEDFAYRVDIGWPVFVLSAVISLVVSMATMTVKTISAAMANPVNALRNN